MRIIVGMIDHGAGDAWSELLDRLALDGDALNANRPQRRLGTLGSAVHHSGGTQTGPPLVDVCVTITMRRAPSRVNRCDLATTESLTVSPRAVAFPPHDNVRGRVD